MSRPDTIAPTPSVGQAAAELDDYAHALQARADQVEAFNGNPNYDAALLEKCAATLRDASQRIEGARSVLLDATGRR